MALRWMGKERAVNAGNNEFISNDTSNEMDLMKADLEGVLMNTQSCMDHSILAIFEDSTVASEDRVDVEEESESSLLTALTEILDSVEDDGGTLSPFDTLPDSEYLKEQRTRTPVSEGRQRKPKLRSSGVVLTQRKGEPEDESQNAGKRHGAPQPLRAPYQKAIQCTASLQVRAESDTGLFTSASLVDLVRLMHPYCLQVHLEEDRKSWPRRTAPSEPHADPTALLPSQGEILKYVKPSGDSDEEIDVDLLDDDGGGGGGGGGVRANAVAVEAEGVQLRGVLVSRATCRGQAAKEKKRVSFGPVQVESIGEPEEEQQGESDHNRPTGEEEEKEQTAALTPDDLAEAVNPDPPPPCGPAAPQTAVTPDTVVLLSSAQAKPRPLSLQQYRQLRQERRPLAETQGDNTTKWPLLSEAPQELLPFLYLQGTAKAQRDPDSLGRAGDKAPGGPTSSGGAHPRRTKRSRAEHKGLSAAAEVKPAAVSSDPPNPVLLPMPAARPSVALDPAAPPPRTPRSVPPPTTGLLHEIHRQLAKTELRSTEPPTPRSAPPHRGPTADVSPRRTEPRLARCPTAPAHPPAPETGRPQVPDRRLRPVDGVEPSPDAPQPPLRPGVSRMEDTRRPPALRSSALVHGSCPTVEEKKPTPTCGVSTPLGHSGIEASDLTSLLEQFEETQEVLGSLRREPAGPGPGVPPAGTPNPPPLADRNPEPPRARNPDLPTCGVPSTPTPCKGPGSAQDPSATKHKPPAAWSAQRRQPAKPKGPGARSIQIIDPQPLPFKKTQTQSPCKAAAAAAAGPQTPPTPHPSSSHVTSDHDYCAPQDPPPGATRGGERDASAPLAGTPHTRTSCPPDAPSKHADAPENLRAAPDPRPPLDPAPALAPSPSPPPPAAAPAEDRATQGYPSTPPTSPPGRGRGRETSRRYRKSRRSDSGSNSPSSSSSSSSSCSSSSCGSGSPSPKRKRFCPQRSGRRSCTSSSSGSGSDSGSPPRRYHFTYSRSRSSTSRSWSRSGSRSRSRSPRSQRRRWRREVHSGSKERRQQQRRQEMRIHKLKAIDERRVVYVGRIRRSMTHDELQERFTLIGEVESVSLHFRDRRDSYGFVTFCHMEDAFAAIEKGSQLRRPDELPFDICFGGRRQFCKSDYADLDSTKDDEAQGKFEDLDFDSLLKQAQKGGRS